jgi:hypothetical protein
MKPWIKNLILGAVLAGTAAMLGACVATVGPDDYYGPAYGGVVVYGHPYYGGGGYWGGGPYGRRWR